MSGLPLVVDSGKKKLSSVIEWGRRKMLEGAYDVAIQHFSIALDLKPGLIHALVSRGFCHLTLGDEEKAQKDFAEVIAKDAGFNRNVYVLIALCCKRSGDYHTAIRYLSRCVQQFTSFKPALVARGELSLKVREFEKARMDFHQVLADTPHHLVARRGMGDALRGLGNFREALRHYSKAMEDAFKEYPRWNAKVHASQMRSDDSRNGSDEAGNSGSSPPTIQGAHRSSSVNSIVEVDEGSEKDYVGLDEGSDDASSIARRGGGRRSSDDDDDASVTGDLPGSSRIEQLQEEVVRGPVQIQAFVTEVLLRRALLLRLIGDLDAAGADLLEVLQTDPQNGLALFWYAKVLIEQSRHREAPAFLQACLNHLEDSRDRVYALIGTLLLTRPDPDFDEALRYLKEAVRLTVPSQLERSQPIKITMYICAAACALHGPLDPHGALGHLDKALAALTSVQPKPKGDCGSTTGRSPKSQRSHSPLGGGVPKSARGTPRLAAGSAGNAVVALAGASKSIEEATWSTARALVMRRQELAQGDDMDLALQCTTYLQLVAREPHQQMSSIPPLLYALRAVASCVLGRWEDCCMDCRRALALDPDDEATQYNMHIAGGILRSKALEFEAAVGRFTKAIRLRPVHAEVRVHRAISLAMAAKACGPSDDRQASQDKQRCERQMQLLSDALADLEAAEQQAMISGTGVPCGTSRLRAACLCSLGRVEEAWEVLQERSGRAGASKSQRQLLLEAEVLILLGRHVEACECCALIISSGSTDDQVAAHLMRGRCYSHLGELESAFEDFRAALVLAPERADVHEATAELYLKHGCFKEAITAFNTAAKLAGSLSPRLTYARALAHLALGLPGTAVKDWNRTLRLNPNLAGASRARDGAGAIQMAMDGEYRHAHVRLNILLHPRLHGGNANAPPDGYCGLNTTSSDGLPSLFLNHELVLYRGVCSLYLGDSLAAAQDFQAALELAQQSSQLLLHQMSRSNLPSQQYSGGDHTHDGSLEHNLALVQPPELISEEGQHAFECEMLYNITLCQLLAKDHRGALATCERLLQRPDALALVGSSAQCLIWFLVGVCRLALGEGRSEEAREAFMHSYAHDPVYVDDFLHRHEPNAERGYGGGVMPVLSSNSGPKSTPFRPIGGPSPPPGGLPGSRDVCDAAPEAVCCLCKEQSRLSARFPPLRLQVKDVVIWGKPSLNWPFIRTPELVPSSSLARLDILSHHEVGVNPAPPWDRLS